MMTKDPDPAAPMTAAAQPEISATTRAKPPAIAMARHWRGWRSLGAMAAVATAGTALVMPAGVASAGTHDSAYRQVNMVSDIPGLAAQTDPDLVNSWGVSASPGTDQAPGSALWVSDNHADKTTLYAAGATATTVTKSKLVVTISAGAPTGQVNNSDPSPGDFVLHNDATDVSAPAVFLFAWFGNGNAAKTNELLFTAGPGGEQHGLLGKIVLDS